MLPCTRAACISIVLTTSGRRPSSPKAARSSRATAALLLYIGWLRSCGPRQETETCGPASSTSIWYRSMARMFPRARRRCNRATAARSECASPLQDADDDHHDGHHEQDVDQAAQIGEGDIPQQPE